MTIDTQELRRLTQAALTGPDGVSLNWLKLLQDFQKEANPAVINELLDRLELAESRQATYKKAFEISENTARDLTEKVIPNIRNQLEAAEKDIVLKERIIDALGKGLNTVAKERDAMRAELAQLHKDADKFGDGIDWIQRALQAEAKVAEMEKQEPVGTLHDDGYFVWSTPRPYESNYAGWKMKLYLAPGAQPAQQMDMQTADQITQAFKSELQALLDKYGAELSARDKWEGYPECGEDVRMQVDVPAIYDADHNCLREYTEIDLGSWVPSTQAMPKEAKP